MTSIDIKLARIDRIHRPDEVVKGNVIITHQGPMAHQGITLKVEGAAKLQLSAKSVGLIEAIYNSVKPYTLLDYEIPMASAGKIPDGTTQIPFEFKLEGFQGRVS